MPTDSTSTSHGAPDSHLYIRDMLSRRLFLVDTGAMISVFPHRSSASATTSLCAAGGQPIASWGKRTIPLSFSSTSSRTHRFDWNFTLAAVDRPILGADFLQHHQFEVSIARHLVSVDGEVQLLLLPSSSPSTLLSRCPSSTRRFWRNFPRLLALVLALSSMMFTTTSRRRAQPWRAAWTPRSMPPLRPSLRRWRRPASSGGAIRLGPLPSRGAETRRFLGPLWRFSPSQQCNSS